MGITPIPMPMPDMYDETLNPTIANVFAACAFRFAHTLIPVNNFTFHFLCVHIVAVLMFIS